MLLNSWYEIVCSPGSRWKRQRVGLIDTSKEYCRTIYSHCPIVKWFVSFKVSMCWRVEERFSLEIYFAFRMQNTEEYSWNEVCRDWIERPVPKLIASEQSFADSVCARTRRVKIVARKRFYSLPDPRLKYFQRERNFPESSHSKKFFFKSLDPGNQITRCKPYNTEAFTFVARNTILNYRRRLFSVNCRSTMHNATDEL